MRPEASVPAGRSLSIDSSVKSSLVCRYGGRRGGAGVGAHTMTEARVPRLPVDEAKAAADEAGVPDYMAELAVFQVLLNHPKLACALNDLLATMLWRGTLDPRLRELVIMRIGWLTASDYEWTQHWRVAQGLGVSADDLLGVRDWQAYQAFGSARAGGAGGHR